VTFTDAKFEMDDCRIFISDEQNRARTRCWYFRSKCSGVYIGPDLIGHAMKLSFHSDDESSRDGCNSQWGLNKVYKQREILSGTPHLPPLMRWKRPETPSMGLAQVASILFPTDFLGGSIHPFKPGRKRLALPMAPPHHAIEIGVFYSREEALSIKALLVEARSTPIGYISLPGGENVAVAARQVPFDSANIRPPSQGVRHALSGAPKPGESIDACGVLLHHEPANGEIVTLGEINGITIKGN
jgi:hypothetical protein